MATLQEQIAAYVDKLVLQYRLQPKARATIAIMVKQVIGDGVAFGIESAFSIETAVGVQLDTLGKYVGIPRGIGDPVPVPYFGLWSYASARSPALYKGTWNPATNTPALPAAGAGNTGWWYAAIPTGTSAAPIVASFEQGNVIFSNGTVWAKATADNANGMTSYTDATINANAVFYDYSFSGSLNTDLNDAQYRQVIKLKIIENSNDGTLATIQQILWDFFGGLILLRDNADMTMDYTVSPLVGLPISVLEKYLPKPMAVGITINGGVITGGRILTEASDFLTTEGLARISITS